MELGLVGKVALVTGGSDGLGRATAATLAAEGARVAIVARSASRLEAAAEQIRATGAEVVALPGDVSKAGDCERVVARALEAFGRLDILVNNAGTSMARSFEEVDDDSWQADLDLKLFAAIRLIRDAIPHMRRVGGGRIVNILNIGAKQPGGSSVPTSVSRAAGLALTKALSKQYATEGILVNAVLIGVVRSGQHERRWEREGRPGTLEQFYERMARERAVPVGRVAEASELADLVAFLVSERARYVTGVAINFDGGASAVV
ncbi:MAG TPA: SDR family NAD(P)-dependent oxidoreductase [Chloroflexota bacterium]|jgi:NAD(P)-dependent dehydrogenase (short-subunit alcohol dehydrogenase family)